MIAHETLSALTSSSASTLHALQGAVLRVRRRLALATDGAVARGATHGGAPASSTGAAVGGDGAARPRAAGLASLHAMIAIQPDSGGGVGDSGDDGGASVSTAANEQSASDVCATRAWCVAVMYFYLP